MKKEIEFLSETISLVHPKKASESSDQHIRRLLRAGVITRPHCKRVGLGPKSWDQLLEQFGLEESVRLKRRKSKAIHAHFFSTYDEEDRKLAEICLATAACGESPQIFWGEKYGAILEKSVAYIKSIGMYKAEELFKAGKLDFPSWVTE